MKRLFFLVPFFLASTAPASMAGLLAGAARIDITHPEKAAGRSPLFAKALVLSDPATGTSAVVITLDVVAIAEIGSVRDPFLAKVRERLKADPGIDPGSIVINASHCHGTPCDDVEEKTVRAVKEAWLRRVPVHAGSGSGHEDRIMENRRLRLKNGKEADVRHAYSMPPDEEIAGVGPIDPEIGILRLDRADNGKPLALVYNFACHPIQGVPGGGNTSDLTGFASQIIEDNLGEGAVVLFLQGCGGDINPVHYKAVDRPRDAEPLGNLLGLSALRASREIRVEEDAPLKLIHETLVLPRADLAGRIESMEKEIDALLVSLKGTSLDLKTFLPLYVKYHLSADYPSDYASSYLRDELLGNEDWKHLDEENRRNMEAYAANIRTMEELTRKQINLALLKKHHARNAAAGKTIDVEVSGLRIGEFRLITFPGELTVSIGLNIKKSSPYERTFVAGYTNGYIYYCPTADQLRNRGGAQEDSDCLLAPEWQKIFEDKAAEILKRLE